VFDELMAKGLQAHQTGRIKEAKSFYEQALAIQSRHADALHLLGVASLQEGDPRRALSLIGSAIQEQPGNPAFHCNLAQVHLALRQFSEAYGAFAQAQALEPRNPQYSVGAANCLAMQGRLDEAESQLREVTARHPQFPFGWYNLGNVMLDLNRGAEAVEFFQQALQLDPELADAQTNLGRAFYLLSRFEDAERAYRKFLTLQPESANGYCNLASVLIDQGRFDEAEDLSRRALRFAPRSRELYMMLGAALAHQGRFVQARDAFQIASDIDPGDQRALWSAGFATLVAGDSDRGLEQMKRALDIQPDEPSIRDALSGVLRSRGEMGDGWRDYGWRAAKRDFIKGNPSVPLASKLPERLEGSHICLLSEQGLGDELFFLRFAPALRSRGARVTYAAHPKLRPMLERSGALDEVIDREAPLPSADVLMLVGDVPHGLSSSEFPPPLALSAPTAALEQVGKRLSAAGPPPYLGVTWRAGTPPERQRGESWSLSKQISPVSLGEALKGFRGTLIALQREGDRSEIDRIAACAGKPVHDFSELANDLDALLALLSLLDEYVGVSSTNMHLRAGAGRTARVLVPQPAEWRWMAAGEESPWFPGFRIYRQAPDGDWNDALSRLTRDLQPDAARPASN